MSPLRLELCPGTHRIRPLYLAVTASAGRQQTAYRSPQGIDLIVVFTMVLTAIVTDATSLKGTLNSGIMDP